jgi:hypothetical protein
MSGEPADLKYAQPADVVLHDVATLLALAEAQADQDETSDAVAGVARMLNRCRADVLAVIDALPDDAKSTLVSWTDRGAWASALK